MMSAGSRPPVCAVGAAGEVCRVCPFQSGCPGVPARRSWLDGGACAVCAASSAAPAMSELATVTTKSSFFMWSAPLLDRREVSGDVVHALVLGIVQLPHHGL